MDGIPADTEESQAAREQALFSAALQRPVPERASFLDGACHGDPALRQRLAALIEANDSPATELADDQIAVRRVTGVRPSSDESIAQSLGRYKPLEKLGEGGCGVVYVAEQTEPVRRRVALKVIKLGMDTKAVVARFDAERQALALMDHPNIAKVLDAGTTDTGRPFFVMELVRGIRITDYCDQSHLTTQDRLELFIKVCHAVQHAHQKGIIHRDLKPSNILVTLHDGVPVPKVIDFGIAKATEGRLTDATVYTQLHQFIGTPAYMSPEQAEMSGLDIDTRSDIYSLGVLLYELLTGSTPFDAHHLMAQGFDALRRTIREKEPVRPSTRVATLQGDLLTTTAKCRSVEVNRLTHQIRGDLDWIVMKCLEKDRTRRYETANGLATDLRRHLANEPVAARPPSTTYKLQKAIRRNKGSFAVAIVILVALMAGGGSAVTMFLRERAVVRELQAERLAGVVDRASMAVISGDPNAVRLALEEAQAKGVSGGQISVLRGQYAIASGDPEQAVRHLNEAVALMPNSVQAHALLAVSFVQAQRWHDYDRVAQQFISLKERTAEDFLFKGQALGYDDWDSALPLLDRAVSMKPSALAHLLRSEARVTRAFNTRRPADIDAAVDDIQAAKAMSWSQDNLTLIGYSCTAHYNAAFIHGLAGRTERAKEYLAQADLEGQKLEQFTGNPVAAMWRIIQLEMAHRYDGPDGSLAYMSRLVQDQRLNHPLIALRYGNALLRRGDIDAAIKAYESVPSDDWIDSQRLMAIFEHPSQRANFDKEFQAFLQRYPGGIIEMHNPWFLMYAGRKDEAREMARRFLIHMKEAPERFARLRPRYFKIAEFLAFNLSEDELLKSCEGLAGNLCDVHALIGFRRLADGDRLGAIDHFRQAVETGVYMWTFFSLAETALAQVQRHPTWPPQP
jgi:serine/threonine protein kinase/tetratricopeptide (TPR) repeat protein